MNSHIIVLIIMVVLFIVIAHVCKRSSISIHSAFFFTRVLITGVAAYLHWATLFVFTSYYRSIELGVFSFTRLSSLDTDYSTQNNAYQGAVGLHVWYR